MEKIRLVFNGWELRLVEHFRSDTGISFAKREDGLVCDVCDHEPGECDGSFACGLESSILELPPGQAATVAHYLITGLNAENDE